MLGMIMPETSRATDQSHQTHPDADLVSGSSIAGSRTGRGCTELPWGLGVYGSTPTCQQAVSGCSSERGASPKSAGLYFPEVDRMREDSRPGRVFPGGDGTMVKSLNAAYPARPRSSSEYQRHELVRITAAGYGCFSISTTVGVETMPLKRLPTFKNHSDQEAGQRFSPPPKGTNERRQTFQLPGGGDACPCAWCSPSSSGAVPGLVASPSFCLGVCGE
jgi:hypothetical protein